MAVAYSTQWLASIDPSVSPKVDLRPADLAGRVRVSRAVYTTLGTEVSGSTIQMNLIPWNARVLFSILSYDALTNAVTGTVDDGVTSGRWGTFTTLAAAGNQTLYPTTTDQNTAVPTTEPAASALLKIPLHYLPTVITTAAATIGAVGKIVLEVFYVVD